MSVQVCWKEATSTQLIIIQKLDRSLLFLLQTASHSLTLTFVMFLMHVYTSESLYV